jgi:exosortase
MSQQQPNETPRTLVGDSGNGHPVDSHPVDGQAVDSLAVKVAGRNGAPAVENLLPRPDSSSGLLDGGLLGISETTWIKIAVITALFACLFWPNLRRLWDKTNPFYGEANWGHAICVPIIGLYYLYVNRERLRHPPPIEIRSGPADGVLVWLMLSLTLLLPLLLVRALLPTFFKIASMAVAGTILLSLAVLALQGHRPAIRAVREKSAAWFGGFVLIFGIALFGYGIYPGQNDFIKDFGMVVTLFGVVLALTGWDVMRTAWFPIAFLVCGIPWPGLMYSTIASPLQRLAAQAAVWCLEVTGVPSEAGGTKIIIEGHNQVARTLNVAEACAGLRSLMTFVSVGAAVAFLSGRPLWQKITVTLSAIPIAIFCNVMRVCGQGLLDHYVSQQLSENFAHQFVGMIMLIPAFLLILLVGWVLDQIFLEEVDKRRSMTSTKVVRRTTTVAAVSIAVPRRNLSPRGGIAAPAARTAMPPAPRTPSPAAKSPAPANGNSQAVAARNMSASLARNNAAPASRNMSAPAARNVSAPPATRPSPAGVGSAKVVAAANRAAAAQAPAVAKAAASTKQSPTPPPSIRLASRPTPVRKPPPKSASITPSMPSSAAPPSTEEAI